MTGPSTRSRWLIGALVAAVLAAGGFVAVRATRSTVSAMADAPAIPTARVERGALEIAIHMTGELRASRQQAIMAPPVGSALRILSIVDTGTVVEAGDLVLAFDPADQQYALEQAESELLEAEQNILKRQADTGAQDAQDQVALLTARFNVRRAELDALVDRDLIAANEHQIRQVSLEEARRTLERTEQDVAARAVVGKAGLSVLQEARVKAQMAADRARQAMEMLEIRAPNDGVVSVRDNVDSTNILFVGMTLPPYRVGDVTGSGRPVLDLIDLANMEIRSSVNEQDRVNLSVGQTVAVSAQSAPGTPLTARVKAISGLGRPVMREGPLRRFDVTLDLTTPGVNLPPGTSVDLTVEGERIDDVLILPRQAVFEQDGKPIVHLRSGASFEPREVKVVNRSESRVAIEGLEVGDEVALVAPPDATSTTPAAGSTGPAAPARPAPPSAPAVGR